MVGVGVTACVICQRNAPEDGWTVCRRDLNRLDDDLARILELTPPRYDRRLPCSCPDCVEGK
jgi:hypothetical protein